MPPRPRTSPLGKDELTSLPWFVLEEPLPEDQEDRRALDALLRLGGGGIALVDNAGWRSLSSLTDHLRIAQNAGSIVDAFFRELERAGLVRVEGSKAYNQLYAPISGEKWYQPTCFGWEAFLERVRAWFDRWRSTHEGERFPPR